MEGADDVETTACDGEHSEHDAEGQDCLYTEEVSFEEEEGDGLGGTSHGTGMSQKLGWQLRSRKRADQFYAVTGLGVFFVLDLNHHLYWIAHSLVACHLNRASL